MIWRVSSLRFIVMENTSTNAGVLRALSWDRTIQTPIGKTVPRSFLSRRPGASGSTEHVTSQARSVHFWVALTGNTFLKLGPRLLPRSPISTYDSWSRLPWLCWLIPAFLLQNRLPNSHRKIWHLPQSLRYTIPQILNIIQTFWVVTDGQWFHTPRLPRSQDLHCSSVCQSMQEEWQPSKWSKYVL